MSEMAPPYAQRRVLGLMLLVLGIALMMFGLLSGLGAL